MVSYVTLHQGETMEEAVCVAISDDPTAVRILSHFLLGRPIARNRKKPVPQAKPNKEQGE